MTTLPHMLLFPSLKKSYGIHAVNQIILVKSVLNRIRSWVTRYITIILTFASNACICSEVDDCLSWLRFLCVSQQFCPNSTEEAQNFLHHDPLSRFSTSFIFFFSYGASFLEPSIHFMGWNVSPQNSFVEILTCYYAKMWPYLEIRSFNR